MHPPRYTLDQRLRPMQALRLLTAGGAWGIFAEDDLGTVTPRKLADFVVLSKDPRDVRLRALETIDVALISVGGLLEVCAPGYEARCDGFAHDPVVGSEAVGAALSVRPGGRMAHGGHRRNHGDQDEGDGPIGTLHDQMLPTPRPVGVGRLEGSSQARCPCSGDTGLPQVRRRTRGDCRPSRRCLLPAPVDRLACWHSRKKPVRGGEGAKDGATDGRLPTLP